ncbi:MAG: N-acetylmuramic acid 6-phosphate etherase [Erysipelotrichales bacterium]|nr:N-acetylmuramic acid 6-phosphate etherase [Erysipelotrichales bacterium]
MKVDLKKISTENRNKNTMNIDMLDTLSVVTLLNKEDQTVPIAVSKAVAQIASLVDEVVKALSEGGRLIYMGAGTSGRIGILDAVECRPTYSVPDDIIMCLMAGGMQAMTKAVEGAEDSVELAKEDLIKIGVNKKDVIVGITASGRTPYALGGVEYAKTLGCKTGGITTCENSEIAKAVDYPIEAITGAEPVTGSTRMKSGTAQKLVCNMITTAAMIKMGKVYENLMIDMQPTNHKLEARAIRIVKDITGSDEKDIKVALDKFKSVKSTCFALMTGIDSIEEVDSFLNANKGHLRNAINAAIKG